jgi:hypothetical protein
VPARHRVRYLSTLGLAVAMLGAAAGPAFAHRDGCHAAHSCPSDRGTYVCGDTGNYSECGSGPRQEPDTSSGTSRGSADTFVAPPPARDVTAPPAPTLGSASARAGKVTVPVTAEAGSRISVLDAAGATVGTARATGESQTLNFRPGDGKHAYTVTATDSAGNVSAREQFEVTVDATAPAAASVTATPAAGRAAYSDVVIAGETGARYAVRVLRRGGAAVPELDTDGVLTAGRQTVRLLAPNGQYDVNVVLTDEAGNAGAPVTSALDVAVPEPALTLTRTSAANNGKVALRIEGPALGTGSVALTAAGKETVREEFTLDEAGNASVTTTLTDAAWAAAADVVDFQQRAASTQATGLLVDTVAPVLLAAVDEDRAKEQTIAVAFDVEPGTVATVVGAPDGERRFDQAGRQELVERADDGEYTLTLVATDEAGNRAQQQVAVRVTHPLTLAEGLIGLGLLGLLGAGGFFGGRALWRRRDRLGSTLWELRARRERRRLVAAHTAAIADHDRVLVAHQQAVADHGRAQGHWQQTATALREQLAETATFDGSSQRDLPVKTKSGERLYSRTEAAGLVEMRKPRGVETPTVIDTGTLWITDQRVLFQGAEKSREWSFEKMSAMSHSGPDLTLMQVSNRQKLSGVAYPGAGRVQVRRRLELAHATAVGRREQMVTAAKLQLDRHLQNPPLAPTAPPAAPVAPVLPTADDLRTYAGKAIPRPRSAAGNDARTDISAT